MDALLNDFRHQLFKLLNAATGMSETGVSTAREIAKKLENGNANYHNAGTLNPLGDVLESLKPDTVTSNQDCAQLLSALTAISDALPWYKRSAPGVPDFEEGHVNAEILGPKGLEIREDILVGVSLMRPELTYPDHHHPPEEVYVVLSEGLWRQNDAPWWSPGVGGYVYNPPDILHAMKSVETPLCAIWCLSLENTTNNFSLAS